MSFLPKEVEIPEKDPFKNDLLGRKDFSESLIRLFKNSPSGLVISLNARWGEGKTTFTKMWLQAFRNQGGCAVYLNTFEFDYVGDPFLLLASAIYEDFREHFQQKRSDEVKGFQGAAIDMGKHLLSWGLKTGVRTATLNVIDEKALKDLGELPDKLIDGVTDSLASYVEDKIENIDEERKGLNHFRDSLAKLGDIIQQETGFPFIIVLDELDRCKPSFTVEMIERVKHFFSVPNVAFLLVMNREQIEEAIKAQYGAGIDALTYLQKFIDIEAGFPKEKERSDNSYQKYVPWATKTVGCNWYKSQRDINQVLVMFSQALTLSFRDIGKIVQHLALLYRSIEEDSFQMADIFVALCTLKAKYPKVFDEIKHEKITLEKALTDSKIFKALDGGDKRHITLFEKRVAVLSMTSEEREKLNKEDERRKIASYLFSKYHIQSPEQLPATICERIEAFEFVSSQ